MIIIKAFFDCTADLSKILLLRKKQILVVLEIVNFKI
jgi:hypothetical protein